nr:VCBS repeat-containing protein [Terriglobales bacterium]
VIPDTSISFLRGQGDGSFYARRVFNVQGLGAQQKFNNASLTSIASGNRDADANPDLASLDSVSSQIIVLRGKKDGTFGGPRRFQSGKGAVTVALADLNGDGKTDMVTDNSAGISILIGNGNGNFAKHVDYKGSSAAHFIATGDVNGDGKIDVIAANDSAKTVTVFLNDGAGHFNTHLDTSMSNEPFLVAVGDFNGDGKLDVITANRGDTHAATILIGNGDGSFAVGTTYATKHVNGIGVLGLAVADFNLDGKLDFAIGSGTTVYVFPGNGDGTFGNYVPTPNILSYAMQAGDFNRDGKPDLVVVFDGDEELLIGQGDGTFKVQDQGAVESSFAAAVADFNLDGAPDIVLGGDISNTVTVLLNTGAK